MARKFDFHIVKEPIPEAKSRENVLPGKIEFTLNVKVVDAPQLGKVRAFRWEGDDLFVEYFNGVTEVFRSAHIKSMSSENTEGDSMIVEEVTYKVEP